MKDGIYRNTCPRNCYGTCGMLSYVQDNQLIKVTGDPKNGFNKGKLCAKGYAATQYVYNSQRLQYPMKQVPRGSNNWIRISWDEAYTIIAEKILELYHRYGSHLACGYNKFSGNLGILHYATEGMFNSLGGHTKPVGNLCALTGINAIQKAFGTDFSGIPEKMAFAKLIIIWGANPAVTNIHQMKYIYEARRNGAKLVVIDPVFTETAKKADLYIQINPGSDVYLALAIAKIIVEKDLYATEYMEKHVEGWTEYKHYLLNDVDIDVVIKKTGVVVEAIDELVHLYCSIKPAVTWNGLGIQRNEKGRVSISAINSLAALTGNLEVENGGIYYLHSHIEAFPLNLLNIEGPKQDCSISREIDISDFAKEALALTDPPLKLLWIASRNIITQDQNLREWEELLEQQELIVAVDLFMTKTVEKADIVLPAATQFEEEDLHVGYWHYWLSLNQKAIPAYYETKSDLMIARELMRKVNELHPGMSTFPSDKNPIDWIEEELTPEIKELYQINSLEDLNYQPYMKQVDVDDSSMQRKFHVFSEEESKELSYYDALLHEEEMKAGFFRLITPQSLLRIHSQYEHISWLKNHEEVDSVVEVSKQAAKQLNIENNSQVKLYNDNGSFIGKALINPHLPKQVILVNQAGNNPINRLIGIEGKQTKALESVHFYNSIVQMKKWRNTDV
ncbi:molybdopterin-dependent oxidoreductase [Bacillus massiliigorillae]|uniref:molybdopterin-dependent oxidoreductase n=1 Tax=Bacillus massiliigorillae TaxID=1243664 RepID=UPI0005A9F771|nr:molybdopterin-dependent oxidoreductase [Bacillus massiliigorillae]